MNANDACTAFKGAVDAMLSRQLAEEERLEMLAHAAQCETCSALMRLREGLIEHDLAALELQVPPEAVDGMWSRVAPFLRWTRLRNTGRSRWMPYAVPLLSAATVVLSCLGGYLAIELRTMRTREAWLMGIVRRQERLIAPAAGMPRLPSPGIVETMSAGAEPWLVSGKLPAGEFITQLERLPADYTIVSPRQSRFLRNANMLRGAMGFPGASPALDDGLQAGEILAALDEWGVAPSTPIDLRRLRQRIARMEDLSRASTDRL